MLVSTCRPDSTVAVALEAMATRFEILLHGDNPTALRAAGEEALAEIARLEARLSIYRPDSEIARVNALAARQPVRVTPEVFALLQRARQLSAVTNGAFDITIAPLVKCWGFMGGRGHAPTAEALLAARACVGPDAVMLDATDFTVRFARPGVMLDLGAAGKGYAIEQAAMILREAGVTSALLHGGTSTAYAIGRPPDATAWRVALDRPLETGFGKTGTLLTTVELVDEALSVSAVWGKCFTDGHLTHGHVIDPRSGRPVDAAVMAAVVCPSATESDALATALLVLGPPGIELIAASRPGLRALVAARADSGFQFVTRGLSIQPADASPANGPAAEGRPDCPGA